MKKHYLIGMLAIGGLSIFTACNDDITNNGERQGRIFPSIGLDTKVVSSYEDDNATSRSSAGEITVSDLSLRLTRDDGGMEQTWNSVDEFPATYECPIGAYTIEAFYGNINEEGFEKPYYYGSDRITVLENRTTPVNIEATLGNTMVSVDYTDAFKNYFADYRAEISSTGGDKIVYVPGETRPAYFRPGKLDLGVRVTDQQGRQVTLNPASVNAEAKHHYHITYDVNGGEVGKAFLTILFDDLLEKEDVIIELSEELMNAPAPELTPVGFTAGETTYFTEGSKPESSVSVNIVAKGGIASVEMTTESTSLIAQGWPRTVELANADAQVLAKLNSLGLKTIGLSGNLDKMAVVQLANVISNIKYVEGDDNISTFTFTVKDKYGKVNEQPLTLSVGLTQVSFNFGEVSPLYEWATTLDFTFSYNGANPQEAVAFKYANDRGTFDNAEVTLFEAVAGAENTYRVNLTVPSSADALRLQAIVDGKTFSKTIERVDADQAEHTHVLSAPANGVFGWEATMNLVPVSRSSRSGADYAVKISTDGTAWADASIENKTSNTFKLTGLKAGQNYQVRAIVDGVPTAKFLLQTEAGAQLPNNGLEEWSRTDGQTKYWWIEYPNTDKANGAWATMNELTTSEGGSGTNAFNHKGASYCAFSGTRATEDKVAGSYAALIETVGWGDNDANGSTSVGKGCKNLTVGELFLGSYDSASKSAIYSGTAFTSRPSSMTFHYKYSHKNSADFGTAEIEVLNAEGKTIASGSLQLNAVSNYTEQSIPLTYNSNDGKAAKVKVAFKSSGNPDCQSINTTNLSCPSFGNTTDGRFTGSSLWIDEITLNY